MSDLNFEPNSIGYSEMENFESYMVPEERGNIILGFIGGMIAAIIGAGIWAGIGIFSGYEYSAMPLEVGILVGGGVYILGRGRTLKYRITAALLALFGCFLGHVFSFYGVMANEFHTTMSDLYGRIGPVQILMDTFEVFDIIFYGLAVYLGYKLSTYGR